MFQKKLILLIFLLSFQMMLSNCGKVTNNNQSEEKWNNIVSLMFLESRCQKNHNSESAIYKEIVNFQQELSATNFVFRYEENSANFYDYQAPLVVNEEILKSEFAAIKEQRKNNSLSKRQWNRLLDLANRYEGMKCQFASLMGNAKNDLRPYLDFVQKCGLFSDPDCSKDVLDYIFKSNDLVFEASLMKICQSNLGQERTNGLHCKRELNRAKRENKLTQIASDYLKKYKENNYQKFFQLKTGHNRFQCHKDASGLIQMQIKVYNGGIEPYRFSKLLTAIEYKWQNSNIKMSFIEVQSPGENVMEIRSLKNGVSHVASNLPLTIFINDSLDLFEEAKIAAHEFGHILGFPDCYIEFFDVEKSQLVYYEIMSEKNNIMCSLNYEFVVFDSYFQQIERDSCIF